MHRKLFTIFGIVMILVLLTGNMTAQAATLPPITPTPPASDRYSALQAPGSDGVFAQAIAMGKPGTVYGYAKTFGVTDEAYPVSNDYLNGPNGIAFDTTGNVYVVEETGARLIKYAPDGSVLWTAGMAGMHDFQGYGFEFPREVAMAPDGSVWVADQQVLTHVSADGTILGHFPNEPWNLSGDDPMRFNELRGIAFDSLGHMYVSNRWSNEAGDSILVFDMTDPNFPQFDRSLKLGFSPTQIVIDGDDNLYVLDTNNFYVKKCVPTGTVWPWDWDCANWHGDGTDGNGDNQISWAFGLGIDADNDIFIGDVNNGRVKKCDTAGVCEVMDIAGLRNPTDMAVSPLDGNLYIVDYMAFQIKEVTMDGVPVVGAPVADGVFAGSLSQRPYEDTLDHLNTPYQVDVDAKGNLVVAEEWGRTVTKLAPDGSLLWRYGEPGINHYWDGTYPHNPRAVAFTLTGDVLYNQDGRVAILNGLTGTFKEFLGPENLNNPEWEIYGFWNIGGIVVDKKGNIYVSDMDRQRVMVFDKNQVFVRSLGVDQEPGRDSAHFNRPLGLAVDAANNLYVTDSQNFRVQKFSKTGSFLMTIGTGVPGNRFDQMAMPVDVAVDKKGNVIVGEEWENRVQVFDKTGAYLTTVGQGYGAGSSDFRRITGVAVDKAGNLYISAWNSQRVQKFTLGVANWAQINLNGFGNRDNIYITALGTYKNQLVAGISGEQGARIYRKAAAGWETLMDDNFDGNNSFYWLDQLVEYKGWLYAGGSRGTGELWRSPDGYTWMPVTQDGFGDPNNLEVFQLKVMGDRLCAGTWATQKGGEGGEVWCSTSGDPDTWQQSGSSGFGDLNNYVISALATVSYNSISTDFAAVGNKSGAAVYRRYGSTWTAISTPGFGSSDTNMITGLVPFNGALYAVAQNNFDGGQLWRCKVCDGSNPTDWQPVTTNGFDDPENFIMPGMTVVKNTLYVVFGNPQVGMTVWGSTDGTTWKQVGFAGMGDGHNGAVFFGNAVLNYKNSLYVGTMNDYTGGELWKFCGKAKTCK